MYDPHPPRTLSAAASVAIVAFMGAVLMFGLRVQQTIQRQVPLISLNFTPPEARPTERPKPPEVRHARKPAPKHEASPRNMHNQATAVVAPPVRPIIVPPAVVTAPQAGIGAAANTGASNRPGPGQGAGGVGNGNGGGGLGGEGEGDGDSVVGPERIQGSLHYSDLPEGVLAPGQEATVEVIDRVEADGHVSRCRVEHSSGYRVLDNLACRLIEQRYRYRPARDSDGHAVWSLEAHSETWIARDDR
ncbi:MAG TPA: energy transducer TonB [Croceibacterium sp.]|nr:energy transducer TonB [Croceibacterium sp.]